jgi:hypothetical protein
MSVIVRVAVVQRLVHRDVFFDASKFLYTGTRDQVRAGLFVPVGIRSSCVIELLQMYQLRSFGHLCT